MACDALSSITDSTAEGGDDDRPEASFARMEQQVYTTAMRKTVPAIKAKAETYQHVPWCRGGKGTEGRTHSQTQSGRQE